MPRDVFISECSRRREEADLIIPLGSPPPHIGGYNAPLT